MHTNIEYIVELMHIDFRIKNTTWKMTSHECENPFQKWYSGEIIYNLDFWHILDEQLKDKLCAVLLNNLNHVGLLQVLRMKTEQAYHKIYLVYAW